MASEQHLIARFWISEYLVDVKTYELTIYSQICVKPCSQDSDKYWRCETLGGRKEYCSPDGKTYRGDTCTSSCDYYQGRSYPYYWCNTQKSWDYCSPQHLQRNTRFPDIQTSWTIENSLCTSACTNDQGTSYYWCNTESTREGWDYCSKPTQHGGSYQMTYTGMVCDRNRCSEGTYVRGACGLSCSRVDFYFCTYQGTWDYCSANYKSSLMPMPEVDDCQVITRPDGSERCVDSNGFVVRLSLDYGPRDLLKVDDNWFLVNGKILSYHQNHNYFLKPEY